MIGDYDQKTLSLIRLLGALESFSKLFRFLSLPDPSIEVFLADHGIAKVILGATLGNLVALFPGFPVPSFPPETY